MAVVLEKKKKEADLEVEIKSGDSRAIIEGKTSVPFKRIVQLVLQRKVGVLFENWGSEPVIINSELLTDLASAPQDSAENKKNLVLVTLGVGVLSGVFCFSILQILMIAAGITLGQKELFYIVGSMVGLAALTVVLMRIRQRTKSDKVVETMESLAAMLKK